MRDQIDHPVNGLKEDVSDDRIVHVEGFLLIALGISSAICLSVVANSHSNVIGLVCGYGTSAVMVLLGLGIRPPKRQ